MDILSRIAEQVATTKKDGKWYDYEEAPPLRLRIAQMEPRQWQSVQDAATVKEEWDKKMKAYPTHLDNTILVSSIVRKTVLDCTGLTVGVIKTIADISAPFIGADGNPLPDDYDCKLDGGEKWIDIIVNLALKDSNFQSFIQKRGVPSDEDVTEMKKVEQAQIKN